MAALTQSDTTEVESALDDTTDSVAVATATGASQVSVAWTSYTGDKKTYKRQLSESGYKSSAIDNAAKHGVRRPYRGLSIKKESFASISIVDNQTSFATDSKGDLRAIKNSSVKDKVAFTSNFLINSVSESRQEKSQPVSTFGKDYVYFFGEQPRQMTFNCTLLNTDNFRWEEEWWHNYEEYFRGTRLAARSEQARIRLDESIVYGYMIACSANKDSGNPHVVTLSFTVHVTDIVSTRESKIGSHLIDDSESQSYGYVDLGMRDLGSPGVDIPTFSIGKDSQAVRQYNIKKARELPEPGLVGRMKNTVQNWGDTLTEHSQNLVDFIYGRNIVLPADAAYAQFSSGNPSYAEGTDAFNALQNATGNESINVGKGSGAAAAAAASGTIGANGGQRSYTDNFDEYPFTVVIGTLAREESSQAKSVTDKVIETIASEFNVDPESLKADENGVIDGTAQGALSKVLDTVSKKKVAFAAFQIGVGKLNSDARKKAYSEGKYKVFPNEYFSSGLLSLQYMR